MTNFLQDIPDQWALLSIVQAHPDGIGSYKLAKIATGKDATTGVVNEVRNRMLAHIDAGRVSQFSDGTGGVTYKPKRQRAKPGEAMRTRARIIARNPFTE